MKRLKRIAYLFAAGVFLVEAWLWDVLYALIIRLLSYLHIEKIRIVLIRALEPLPASMCVFVFIIPVLLILPLKILAVWLFVHRHFWLGIGTFLLAKLVGLGIAAFLFETCKGKLLALRWFSWLYYKILAIKTWSHRQVAPVLMIVQKFRRHLRGEKFWFMEQLKKIRRQVLDNARKNKVDDEQ